MGSPQHTIAIYESSLRDSLIMRKSGFRKVLGELCTYKTAWLGGDTMFPEDMSKADETVTLDAVSKTRNTTDKVLDCVPLSSPP